MFFTTVKCIDTEQILQSKFHYSWNLQVTLNEDTV